MQHTLLILILVVVGMFILSILVRGKVDEPVHDRRPRPLPPNLETALRELEERRARQEQAEILRPPPVAPAGGREPERVVVRREPEQRPRSRIDQTPPHSAGRASVPAAGGQRRGPSRPVRKAPEPRGVPAVPLVLEVIPDVLPVIPVPPPGSLSPVAHAPGSPSAAAAPPPTVQRVYQLLESRQSLAAAVVLHEILGPPAALRGLLSRR